LAEPQGRRPPPRTVAFNETKIKTKQNPDKIIIIIMMVIIIIITIVMMKPWEAEDTELMNTTALGRLADW